MDEQTVLNIMDAMAEKIEALTERIAAMERRDGGGCSCKKWANDLRHGAMIYEPCTLGDYLTQEEVNRILSEGSKMTATQALEPHQQRVVEEKQQLDERLAKLETFLTTALFISLDEEECERLRQQADAMTAYSNILGERIAAFK